MEKNQINSFTFEVNHKNSDKLKGELYNDGVVDLTVAVDDHFVIAEMTQFELKNLIRGLQGCVVYLCETCGKEHRGDYGKGKYCSKECSKNRKRKK